MSTKYLIIIYFLIQEVLAQNCTNLFDAEFLSQLENGKKIFDSGCSGAGSEKKIFDEISFGSDATTIFGAMGSFDTTPIDKMNEDIFNFINRVKCSSECQQINSSDILFFTRPAKTLKEPKCEKEPVEKQKFEIVKSPIFVGKVCDEAKKQALEWNQKVVRGKNKEGIEIENKCGDNCSFYITTIMFAYKENGACKVFSQLGIKFGDIRASYKFKAKAEVTQKWACIGKKEMDSK